MLSSKEKEEILKDYGTAVYCLNKYNQEICLALNETIINYNNITDQCSESDKYNLLNDICKLAVATEITELLSNLSSLQEAYTQLYETGTMLYNNRLIQGNDLRNIKNALDDINKICTDDWLVQHNFFKEKCVELCDVLGIDIYKVCPTCGVSSSLTNIIVIDNKQFYLCPECAKCPQCNTVNTTYEIIDKDYNYEGEIISAKVRYTCSECGAIYYGTVFEVKS